MKITIEKKGQFLLTDICDGDLFEYLDKVYQKTTLLRDFDGEDIKYVFCVCPGTGRTSHFPLDMMVNKVEQLEPLQLKVVR